MNMGMKRCGGDAQADNIVLSSSLKLLQTHRHACTCIVVFFSLIVIVVGGAYTFATNAKEVSPMGAPGSTQAF
jgi:hypothetical protein